MSIVLTDEERLLLANVLEMRLQRCQDNNWMEEAEQVKNLLTKIQESK